MERRSVSKTGINTEFVSPDVSFETVFTQESILSCLQKMFE